MVRAREDDPLDAIDARGFVQVVDADDVGLEDRIERHLDRHAAQVHDRIDTAQQIAHRGAILEPRVDEFFALCSAAEARDIGQSQHFAIGFQSRAQLAAQATGSAGQQQALKAQ